MSDKKETALAGAALHFSYSNDKDNHTSEGWQRVTARNRCSICGRSNWCVISGDGAVAGCMRISRGAFRTRCGGAGEMFFHRLRDDWHASSRLPVSVSPQRKRPKVTVAAVDDRHRVYTSLLSRLTLSRAHAGYLLGDKGMTEETTSHNLYVTTASEAKMTEECARLALEHDLTRVPGFCRSASGWQFMARPGELLIPVRDERERIVAILRRTGGMPKYCYASSATRGVSCGTPLHWALPYPSNLKPDDPIIITEGVLKADCIAERLHHTVIGVPGVSCLGGVEAILNLLIGRKVQVAFDADEQENPHVRKALVRLLRMLWLTA